MKTNRLSCCCKSATNLCAIQTIDTAGASWELGIRANKSLFGRKLDCMMDVRMYLFAHDRIALGEMERMWLICLGSIWNIDMLANRVAFNANRACGAHAAFRDVEIAIFLRITLIICSVVASAHAWSAANWMRFLLLDLCEIFHKFMSRWQRANSPERDTIR